MTLDAGSHVRVLATPVARVLVAALLLGATSAALAWGGSAAVDGYSAAMTNDTNAAASAEPASPEPNASWWTGSLLSTSAETMAVSHWLMEPFLANSAVTHAFDSHGRLQNVPAVERTSAGVFVMYGLADGISIGAVPRAQLREHDALHSGTATTVGDTTTMLQIRLRGRDLASWLPAVSLLIAETLPTGRFDHLSGSAQQGSGSGVYRTDVALYAQSLFYTPGNHPLRARINLTYSTFGIAKLSGVSVYGTPHGFRGRVDPGPGFAADTSFELSLSPRWVLALDVFHAHQESVSIRGAVSQRIGGSYVAEPFALIGRASSNWILAPAIERNFNSNVGVITGIELTISGHNVSAARVPAVAINMYF